MPQVELAMSLYRDVPMVKLVLDQADLPEHRVDAIEGQLPQSGERHEVGPR